MRRLTVLGLTLVVLGLVGCGDDDSGTSCVDNDGDGYGVGCELGEDCDDNDNAVHTGCSECLDLDGDGHDAYDAGLCPSGDDQCDGDSANWTTDGCTSCEDGDGDGYGAGCDQGDDCDDGDAAVHTGCSACQDLDGDGHDAHDAALCPGGDDECDDDPHNWTATGCASCADTDGDGYGVDCDQGPDCLEGDPLLHAQCQTVWFRGDYLVNDTDEVSVSVFPGPTTTTLSLTGLDTTAQTHSMAVSPNGALLAVSGTDGAGNNVLNLYDAVAGGSATTLASYSQGWDVEIDKLAFSPDGAWIAFLADLEADDGFALYAVPVDGSAAPTLVSQSPASADNDVLDFAWSPHSSNGQRHIAYRGSVVAPMTNSLWVVDLAATAPAPAQIQDNNVLTVAGFDMLNRVYFRYQEVGVIQLWRSDALGNAVFQVPGTIMTNGDGEASIRAARVSPTGNTLAFTADAPTRFLYEVFVMDLTSNTPEQVSSTGAITPPWGDHTGPVTLVWSPDETLLGARADWLMDAGEADGNYALWVLPASLPAGGVRLVEIQTLNANMDVVSVAFSADSQRLFFTGDLVDGNEYELYSTADFTTPSQDPTLLLLQDVVTDGDVTGMVVR